MTEIPEEWKKWYEEKYGEKKEKKLEISLAPEFKEKLVNIGKIIFFVIIINFLVILNVLNITGVVGISQTRELVYSEKELVNPSLVKTNVSIKVSNSGVEISSLQPSAEFFAKTIKVNKKNIETQPNCINETCKSYSKCPESISFPFIPYDIDITYILDSEIPMIINDVEKTGEIKINKVPKKFTIEWQEVKFKC